MPKTMKERILKIINRRLEKQSEIERKAKKRDDYVVALEASVAYSEPHSLIVEVMDEG